MSPKIISMWSGPRNVSTAIMYAFAQRTDTKVLDEPLYAHYLRLSGAEHPGKELVLENMEQDGRKVFEKVVHRDYGKPVNFIKNMAHHFIDLDFQRLEDMDNIFLIRDPEEMLPSLCNQLPNPLMRDTGLDIQVQILDWLIQKGENPIVIDSKNLLNDPTSILNAVCEQLGLEFTPKMLSWNIGGIPEDGVWAPYWYHNIHQSTGFMPYKAQKRELPPFLAPLLEACKAHYETLKKYVIK